MSSESKNNPFFIKNEDNSKPWKGCIGVDAADHCIFEKKAQAVRALVRTLQSKARNGKRSLVAIMADYAPKNDRLGGKADQPYNDPAAYAATIAGQLNVLPQADLDIFDIITGQLWPLNISRLIMLMMAIDVYEDGRPSMTLADILEGLALYAADFCK